MPHGATLIKMGLVFRLQESTTGPFKTGAHTRWICESIPDLSSPLLTRGNDDSRVHFPVCEPPNRLLACGFVMHITEIDLTFWPWQAVGIRHHVFACLFDKATDCWDLEIVLIATANCRFLNSRQQGQLGDKPSDYLSTGVTDMLSVKSQH